MSGIFPDAYFHIGGDETEGKGWLANPRITAFMAKKGLKTPAELQAYFNQRLLAILTKHGKRMVGWDEILNPALPKSIAVESWRGADSLAAGARQGYDGILAAPYYLDAQKSAAQMFLADPVPADTKLSPEEQKHILGGEACMWAEQIAAEPGDSRIWPGPGAGGGGAGLWSPQGDRDVADMYGRLRPASLELQGLGLRQLAGPRALREDLSGRVNDAPLEVLASVLEPVSFSDRYQGQHTDGLSSLNRLVDAVMADPPARQEIAGQVEAVVPAWKGVEATGDVAQGFAPGREDAIRALEARFTAWQGVVPGLLAPSARTPRLNDTEPLALALGSLGSLGAEALAYLQSGRPAPPSWTAHAREVVKAAGESKALVRFAVLVEMGALVEAAAGGR